MANLVPLSQYMAQQRGPRAPLPNVGAPGAPGAAPYADFGAYIDPNTEGAKQWLTSAPSSDPTAGSYVQNFDGSQSFVPTQTYTIDQSKIPDRYKGVITGVQAGPSGNALQYQTDFSKLPKTVFGGSVQGMASLGTGAAPNLMTDLGSQTQHIVDQSQVKFDPQYGWITPQSNIKTVQKDPGGVWNVMDKYAMPAALAVMSMGIGTPAAALATSLFGSAMQYGNTGDWRKALMSAAPGIVGGALGGAFGDLGGIGNVGSSISSALPPEVMRALQIAKLGYGGYNAIEGRNPIAGARTLAGIYQMYGG